MLTRALLLSLAVATSSSAASAALGSNVVTTPQVRAELVAHAPEGIAAGKPMWLGLKLTHQPHWHTYWKNPGDSGLPTTLAWTLPAGVTAGEIDWPAPRRLPIGPLMNHGYEGTVVLPVPLSVPPQFNAAKLEVQLQADWLVCKEVCIPESGRFSLSLPSQASVATHAADFESALAARPQQPAGVAAKAEPTSQGAPAGSLVVQVDGLPAAVQGSQAEVFSELAGVVDHAAPVQQRWQGSTYEARLALSPQRSESPALLPVVMVFGDGKTALRVEAAVQGAWPAAVPAAADLQSSPEPGLQAAAAAPASLGAALLLALLGGALLNLMPCVFPVLSLKVMGFAQHAGEHRKLWSGGLAYTAGVVLSFVALAGLLLALRAAGEQLGWGFQLQSPGFVAALALLFTLIGLNLAGVFEFSTLLPSGLATLRARHPVVDSFLTGVLAVGVASPCTAPFMGVALGVALPYLLVTTLPRVAGWLPRPGAWMVHFKVAMAFPMFATVVWLLWVLGQQTSLDAAAAWLGALVVLAFVAWVFGNAGFGRTGRLGWGAVAVGLLAVALSWALPQLHGRAVAAPSGASAAGERWQPWSPQKVAEATAQGRPVFVDFTAAWCVSCQFNKRTTLSNASLLADFEQRGVVLLRADWTARDATIAAELQRLGRSGVPVYALYAPGTNTPRLLSEILSVDEVRSALASL
jgi:thiol:disulfide interchange protein/DsbC/DsbD-like thiol-disulfide interchange protein